MGNPTSFALNDSQKHNLEGEDELLSEMEMERIIADKGYDADKRVVYPLLKTGKILVISSKSNRKEPRDYHKDLYKARHLIENFFAKLK